MAGEPFTHRYWYVPCFSCGERLPLVAREITDSENPPAMPDLGESTEFVKVHCPSCEEEHTYAVLKIGSCDGPEPPEDFEHHWQFTDLE